MITQRIRILNNQTGFAIFKTQTIFTGLELYEYTALPAWVVPTNLPYITFLTINPTVTGTFTYDFTLGGSPSIADARLIIEVVESLTQTVSTCNNSNTTCLVWITREGGRASYLFDQRKDTGGKLGDSKTFDNNGTIKYINRGKNFATRVVYKTGLSRAEIDLIESLRYSIQTWEYDLTTDVSTPIVINPEDYPKYTNKDKLAEINIKYSIAEYKEVQNQ